MIITGESAECVLPCGFFLYNLVWMVFVPLYINFVPFLCERAVIATRENGWLVRTDEKVRNKLSELNGSVPNGSVTCRE